MFKLFRIQQQQQNLSGLQAKNKEECTLLSAFREMPISCAPRFRSRLWNLKYTIQTIVTSVHLSPTSNQKCFIFIFVFFGPPSRAIFPSFPIVFLLCYLLNLLEIRVKANSSRKLSPGKCILPFTKTVISAPPHQSWTSNFNGTLIGSRGSTCCYT